jgi:hypothetical protein
MMPDAPACFPTRSSRRIEAHVSDLIRTEYGEMPGLSLTLPQAMRLWNLDRQLCELSLDALVADGFLRLSEGKYLIKSPRRRVIADRRARRALP